MLIKSVIGLAIKRPLCRVLQIISLYLKTLKGVASLVLFMPTVCFFQIYPVKAKKLSLFFTILNDLNVYVNSMFSDTSLTCNCYACTAGDFYPTNQTVNTTQHCVVHIYPRIIKLPEITAMHIDSRPTFCITSCHPSTLPTDSLFISRHPEKPFCIW